MFVHLTTSVFLVVFVTTFFVVPIPAHHLCPKWKQTTITYQELRSAYVRCSRIDYFIFPLPCDWYGKREIPDYGTFTKNIWIKTVECCPGFIWQPARLECIREQQDCAENEYMIVDDCVKCDCETDLDNAYPGCQGTTGECSCKPGYTGPRCEYECVDGLFGPDCRYNCLCKENSPCNKTDGQCPCARPGWTGISCTEECPENRYGILCRDTCNCSKADNFYCDGETGCACKPGYMGENCDIVCPTDTWQYGPSCSHQCKCQRLGTHGCDHVTGTCTCKPGWKGEYCSDLCSNVTYGYNCTEACVCESYSLCLPTNGSCVCPQGFTGQRCDQEIKPGEPEGKKSMLLAVIFVVLVIILISISVGIFVWKRRADSHRKLKIMESMLVNEISQDGGNPATPGEYMDIDEVMTVHVAPPIDHDNNYDVLHMRQKDETTTRQSYDHMKLSGRGQDVYDTFRDFHDVQIGGDYDSVKLTSSKTDQSHDQGYDHMTVGCSGDGENNIKITSIVGEEYDHCDITTHEYQC